MLRSMDLWRCAIVKRPADDVVRDGIDPGDVVWLPDMPTGAFRADPFGLWRDRRLHVFVEAFDYRTRIGRIEVLVYDLDLVLLDCRTVLEKPWHLSYPVVFEADGACWMLPEAFKSGTLTLYRARRFPDRWEPECEIPLDGAAIDATPVLHEGRWWLFYTPSRDRSARRSHLHLAWADALTGPWRLHPGNPVRIDLGGARPGGTLRMRDGNLVMPAQDCRTTYGGALRELTIRRLDEVGFSCSAGPQLTAPSWMMPHVDGMHTLSAAGATTLIDVKRMDASMRGKTARLHGIARHWLRTRAG